jgi:hypothetical protein
MLTSIRGRIAVATGDAALRGDTPPWLGAELNAALGVAVELELGGVAETVELLVAADELVWLVSGDFATGEPLPVAGGVGAAGEPLADGVVAVCEYAGTTTLPPCFVTAGVGLVPLAGPWGAGNVSASLASVTGAPNSERHITMNAPSLTRAAASRARPQVGIPPRCCKRVTVGGKLSVV